MYIAIRYVCVYLLHIIFHKFKTCMGVDPRVLLTLFVPHRGHRYGYCMPYTKHLLVYK